VFAESMDVVEEDAPPPNSLSYLVDRDIHVYLLLEGLVDIAQEKTRLAGEVARFQKQVKNKEALLANKGFTDKAPDHVVEAERRKLHELKEKVKALEEIRHALS
ncbi:MAG: valine--tRNA ligase, partial [Candidatus Omnitrophica bacterium]|nr:valine--tRNA ligase [Candidatus Omnitrophota bacterium]